MPAQNFTSVFSSLFTAQTKSSVIKTTALILLLGMVGRNNQLHSQVSVAATYSTSTSSAASTMTWNHTSSGTFRTLVVTAAIDNDNGIDSIKFMGLKLTLARASTHTGDDQASEVWYLTNPPAGTAPITIYRGVSEYMIAGSVELNGVSLSNAVVTSSGQSNPADNSTPSTGAFTTVANGIAISVISAGDDNVNSWGAGQTKYFNANIGGGLISGASTYTTTTTTSANMTYVIAASDDHTLSWISFRPATACASSNNSFSSVSVNQGSCVVTSCAPAVTYTLNQTTASGCEGAIYQNSVYTVNFPTGINVNSVTGITYNGTAVPAGTYTISSSTQIKFCAPVTVNASTAFKIIISGIIEGGSGGNITTSVSNSSSGGTTSGTYAITVSGGTNNSFSSTSAGFCNVYACAPLQTYTLTQTTASTAGCGGAIPSGTTFTVNLPTGMSNSSVGTITFNGSSVSTFTRVSSTQLTFSTPAAVCASTSFTIIITRVQNGGAGGNITTSVLNGSGGTMSGTYATGSFTSCSSTNASFTGTSVSLSNDNACLTSNYTFTQSLSSTVGAIDSAAVITVTIPTGVNAATVTGGTFNGSTITSTFTTTATTISFKTPARVPCTTSFTIVLNGITNSSAVTNNATVSVPNVTGGTTSYSSFAYSILAVPSNTCAGAADITSSLSTNTSWIPIKGALCSSTKSLANTASGAKCVSGSPCADSYGDVWYKFTTPATLDTFLFDLATSSGNAGLQMSLWKYSSGCPITEGSTDSTNSNYVRGSMNCIPYGNSSNNHLNMSSTEFSSNWSVSTTYYLQIYGLTTNSFTLYINQGSGVASNDECTGANLIGSNTTTSSVTAGMGGYTKNPTDPTYCDGSSFTHTAWFKFTADQSGNVDVNFDDFFCNNGSNGYRMMIFKGTCGSLTPLGSCTAGSSSGTCHGGSSSQSTTIATSSTTTPTGASSCGTSSSISGGSFTQQYSICGASPGEVFYLVIDAKAGSCYFSANSTNTTTVPVTLTYFDGKSMNGKNYLSWITQSETNNDYFEILRSGDGYNYEVIGEVKGNGNYTQQANYTFTDHSPPPGVSYYKLKQIDFDGRHQYFGPVALALAAEKGFKISALFPNPVKNELLNYIIASDEEMKVGVFVYDILGNLVYNASQQLNEGYTIFSADFSHLSSGRYFLKIQSREKVLNQSFSVIR